MPSDFATPERVVSTWISAFNARDLDAMLERMSARIDFHPLRFDGLAREYRGHDGVRRWFHQLIEMGHDHSIELAEVRPATEGQTVAFGQVVGADGSSLTPFWSLDRVDGDKMVAAYHYLTDPDIMEYIRS